MASKVNGIIQKIKSGNTTHNIASSAYGVCETAAGTAAKTVDMTGFTLLEGTTVHIKFSNANTAASPTLNVNGTGAKTIQFGDMTADVDGTIGWRAGDIVEFTYDGTSWVANNAAYATRAGSILANNIKPIATKTYNMELYNSSTGANFYQTFATVTPANYNEIWIASYRITITASGHLDYTEISYVSISGRANTYYSYYIYNSLINYPIYYHSYLPSSSASTPHELGYRMASSYGATDVQKVAKVELLEQTNCTVTLLDSLKLYTSSVPSGYYTWYNFTATSNGLQETGDANDTAYYFLTNGFKGKVGANKIYRYCLFARTSDGSYESFVMQDNTRATTKTANPHGFVPDGKIYWNSGNAVYNQGTLNFNPYEQYHVIDYLYSFNFDNQFLPDYCETYIVWTYNSTDGLLYLDTTQWLAAGLPTTADGKIYQRLGSKYYTGTSNYYQGSLLLDNPYYEYKNGAIHEWNGNAVHADTAPLSGISGADDLKAIESLTGTTGLLKKTAANTWTLDTNSYVTSSGVTSVATGAGLTGGPITSTGTISINGLDTTNGATNKWLNQKGEWSTPSDTKVTQSNKVYSGYTYWRPLVIGARNASTSDGLSNTASDTTDLVYTFSSIVAQPSTGTIKANIFQGSGESLTSLNASNISSGTLSADRLATSGATAGSYGPSAAVTGSNGTTMNVPYITVDNKGRVTSISNKVYTAVNTWRGIQDNLTSSTNTTESLSAKQGYLLANGSARDNTKVPLVASTDNAIARFDGTSGQIQDSKVKIDDNASPVIFVKDNLISSSTDKVGTTTKLANNDSDLEWIKALLKQLCIEYPSITITTFKGSITPNSRGYYEIYIYNTSTINTDGLPQYSYGTFRKHYDWYYIIGTNDYTPYCTAISLNGHNHNSSYLTAVGYDSTNKKLYYTKNGSNTNIVTFGSNAFNSTSYLPLSGGVITGGGLEIKGHIAGDGSTTSGHGLYNGGMYHNAYNNIILHGDASTGSSGIAFVSDKVAADGTITNINAPSDRAFIQYHACGVTTATAEGTAPTVATSGEAGRFVIGIGNDSGDKIVLQAPGATDIVHQMGATSYPIPHTTNTNGSVGGTTTPVYVEGGVIKAGTALGTASTHAHTEYALASHTHSTQQLFRPNAINGVNDVTYQTLINDVRANRLAFLPADQIIIEKTTDGGITWVDANVADNIKTGLFSETRAWVSIPLLNGEINTNCGLRITITAMKYNVPEGTTETEKYNYWNSTYIKSAERYNQIKSMYFWVNTANNAMKVKIQRATGASPNSWQNVFDKNDYAMTGWSGNDIITFDQGVFGGGTTQTGNYWNWRIILMSSGPNGSSTLNTGYLASSQTVGEIRGYGDTWWTAGNKYAASDHLYSWDYLKNATFPANVSATKFIGALQGNADTATTASKLGTSNVGSDRQPIYLNGGTATAGNYTVAHLGNAGKTNMNDIGKLWPSTGMTNLTSTSNADTPKNGSTYSIGWHLYWDTSYADNPNQTNAWVAQIINKAGSSQWWVRSRSGGTITNGTAWTSGWRHLVTSSEAAVGGDTQPVYVNTNGEITAGTALKNLAYIDKPSSNQTTTYLRGDGSWVSLSDMGLSSAMHFKGTTTTAVIDDSTTATITINGNSYTPSAGDVVLYSDKEFVWTGSKWELLGAESSFKVVQDAFTNSTGTADSTNTSDAFIYSFSQTANGNITDIKTRKLPEASSSTKGIVLLGAANGAATYGHTHTLSIATDNGTNALTFAANTKYKLTAGGSTYIFTTQNDADKLNQTNLGATAALSSFTDTSALIYTAKGGSNTITDKPTGVDAFGILSFKTADGWYGQILMSSNTSSGLYWRTASTLSGGWKTILDTTNTTAPSSVPTLSWGSESTVFTLNGSAVKIKAMAKPTYTYSDVGAAASNHTHGNITNDGKLSGSTVSGAVTTSHKFLREDGTWVAPAYIANAAYGNISTSGTIGQSSGWTLANGDGLVVFDSSNSNKLERTGITFDASTETQCLTKKGTWKTFGTSNLTIGTTSTTAMAGNTDVNNVTHTKRTDVTTRYFVTGTTSSDTNTAGDIFDTGVYVTTTSGGLSTTRQYWNYSDVDKAYSYFNNTTQSIDFVFI